MSEPDFPIPDFPVRDFPMGGSCRCGLVQIQIDTPPLLSVICHCTGCQKMSSSAHSLTVTVAKEAFSVTKGETVVGGLHGSPRHLFCARCMTWMFTEPEQVTTVLNLRTAMLDNPSAFLPFVETFTNEKLDWVEAPAIRSFPEFPDLGEFHDLMDRYAVWEKKFAVVVCPASLRCLLALCSRHASKTVLRILLARPVARTTEASVSRHASPTVCPATDIERLKLPRTRQAGAWYQRGTPLRLFPVTQKQTGHGWRSDGLRKSGSTLSP